MGPLRKVIRSLYREGRRRKKKGGGIEWGQCWLLEIHMGG